MGHAIFDNIFAGKGGVAQTLVNLFGSEATIYYKTTVVRDMVANTSTFEEVEYITDAAPPLRYSRQHIDGTTIIDGDSYTIVPIYDQEKIERPMVPIGTKVTYPDGVVFDVVNITPYYSGYRLSAYKLQLRRK